MFYINLNEAQEVRGYADFIADGPTEDTKYIKLTRDRDIPEDFKDNFLEYIWDEGLIHQGITPEDYIIKLKQVKEEKLNINHLTKELTIDSIVFRTSRDDILKYKEATDISEDRGLTSVRIQPVGNVVDITIVDMRNYLKIISEQAQDNYWAEHAFITEVLEATTIEAVEAIELIQPGEN